MVILVAGIVGKTIAPFSWMATFPVAFMIIGVVCATIPVSIIFQKLGCKFGYFVCACLAIVGAFLACAAILQSWFSLFCLANFFLGTAIAFGHQTRFIILRGFSEKTKNLVISLYLTGGIASGLLGPEIGRAFSQSLFAQDFAGSYFALGCIFLVALFTLLFYKNIPQEQEQSSSPEEKNERTSLREPRFLVPFFSGVASYALMALIMTATPLQMKMHGNFAFDEIASIIQIHILGMFVPSLFTGLLIDKIGNLKVIYLGIVCFLIAAVAAILDLSYLHYAVALLFLGLGWNFMYLSSTSMLVKYNSPQQLLKIQGKNDFGIFFAQALASSSSGFLIMQLGWENLNSLIFPCLLLCFFYIYKNCKSFN